LAIWLFCIVFVYSYLYSYLFVFVYSSSLATATDCSEEFQPVLLHRRGENEAPVRSLQKRSLIRGLATLFRRQFFRDVLFRWLSPVVGWRQILITAIHSSSEEGFTLFYVTTKQACNAKILPNVLQQMWLACRPVFLMSPDIGLRGWVCLSISIVTILVNF